MWWMRLMWLNKTRGLCKVKVHGGKGEGLFVDFVLIICSSDVSSTSALHMYMYACMYVYMWFIML